MRGQLRQARRQPGLTLSRGPGGTWFLTVSVPKPVAEQHGVPKRVQLRHPVALHHRSHELEQRLQDRDAVRVDVQPATDSKGRAKTYLRISWVGTPAEPATLGRARSAGAVGVDLNADHLAVARLDKAGNPVGRPVRVPAEPGRRPGRGTRRAVAGRGRDRSPCPRSRPEDPDPRVTAAASCSPPERWKRGPHGPGMGNRWHGTGRDWGRCPPGTCTHTTALAAPTPNIGCGHAARAVGRGELRA